MTESSFTFVDLFAGIGGFHAALSSLGGECVYAVEKDAEAARVYEDNWKIPALGDVTQAGWMDKLESDISVDIITAGFPCQPFSKSGAQRGMDETRGTLFFNICEAIERWRPQVVMLENVRNLVGPRHLHEWEVIIRSLRDLGYQVSAEPLILSPHWISPEEGGAPQNRERVYILATRDSAPGSPGTPLTVQLNRFPGPWNLATDLPLVSSARLSAEDLDDLTWSEDEKTWIDAWSALVDLFPGSVPRFPLWVDAWHSSSSEAPAWKARIEKRNREFYHANQETLDSWISTYDVLTFPDSRRKMEWQAQDTRSMSDCLVQFRQSGLRVKGATYAAALVAIDQRPFIVREGRRLSIRECARLQGFPDWFRFDSVPRRAAYKQTGNAIHVGSALYALKRHLKHPETRRLLGESSNLIKAIEE